MTTRTPEQVWQAIRAEAVAICAAFGVTSLDHLTAGERAMLRIGGNLGYGLALDDVEKALEASLVGEA